MSPAQLSYAAMKFIDARLHLNLEHFYSMWPNNLNLGEHLWRQYSVLYKHDIIAFIAYLDDENQRTFIGYVRDTF